jgi:hypothetical protein
MADFSTVLDIVCPKKIREGHVTATCSFLHAHSQLRGSTVRTLIATKSQRRNER